MPTSMIRSLDFIISLSIKKCLEEWGNNAATIISTLMPEYKKVELIIHKKSKHLNNIQIM